MDDLKIVVGKNLAALRKHKKMTQLELAEKMNYSDKAVSKWEQGATMPDLETLKQLCDFYGVTLDYLVDPNNIEKPHSDISRDKAIFINHIIITCLLGMVIWMVATLIFVYPLLFLHKTTSYWPVFVWAIPASAFIMLITNRLYFKKSKVVTLIGVSLLIWATLTGIFLHFMFFTDQGANLWLCFLLGIPLEAMISLWFAMRKK